MQRLIDADALAELFRDMAEFAHLEEARKVLLIAAETVEEQPEVTIPEAELQETAGEPGQGEQEPFRWDVKHGYYGRYLACPLCGYETRDDRQPEREGWSRCPGCGNKCSGGGEPPLRDRKKQRVLKKAGMVKERMPFRNHEGYSDPTPALAMRNLDRKEGEKNGKADIPVHLPV